MDLDLLNNAVARNAKMSRLLLVAYGRMNFIPPSACPRLGADAAVLQRLGRLAARSDFLVGIVSPLSLIQIRSQVHNTRLMCVANHGLEIADAGRNYVHPKAEAERHFLKQATAQLTKNLASHPNCRVENNGLIALVHCGGAARARVRTMIEQALKRHSRPFFSIESVNEGLEIVPNLPWDERSAVRWIERLMPKRTVTFYIGSQDRDEAVFQHIKPHGIGIRTHRKRSSAASFFLRDEGDIPMVLDRLLRLPQGIAC